MYKHKVSCGHSGINQERVSAEMVGTGSVWEGFFQGPWAGVTCICGQELLSWDEELVSRPLVALCEASRSCTRSPCCTETLETSRARSRGRR